MEKLKSVSKVKWLLFVVGMIAVAAVAGEFTFDGDVNISSNLAVTGIVDMNTNKITNLADPTADGDAASKSYVWDALGNIDPAFGDLSMGVYTNASQ